jgi:hypothetical protein
VLASAQQPVQQQPGVIPSKIFSLVSAEQRAVTSERVVSKEQQPALVHLLEAQRLEMLRQQVPEALLVRQRERVQRELVLINW